MIYADKYKLTREQSAFLAKKKWDENVYCGMRMENRAVTFPQTRTILNGVNVPNVQLDDIQAILNMRVICNICSLRTMNSNARLQHSLQSVTA